MQFVHGAPPRHAPRRARQLLERSDHGRSFSRDARWSRRGSFCSTSERPQTAPREWPLAGRREHGGRRNRGAAARAGPWSVEAHGRPQAFVLSNGRLDELVDRLGRRRPRLARPRAHALSDRTPLATTTACGSTCATRTAAACGSPLRRTVERPTSLDKAEFHRRDQGLSVQVDVAVAPADDVEVRQITLHNETDAPATFHRDDRGEARAASTRSRRRRTRRSRACSSRASSLADVDGLLFARRSQSVERGARRARAPPRARRRRREARGLRDGPWRVLRSRDERERARCAVAGRRAPRPGRTGAVLDPVMSVMAAVELKPKRSVTLRLRHRRSRARGAPRSSSPAVRLDARCPLGVPRRGAGVPAATCSARGSTPQLLPSVQRLFSALLFADPALRASRETLVAARPCKSRLWGRGISGDDPIVLVRVNDPEAPILGETLAAQRFLRSYGLRLDVVLVDECASGYVERRLRHSPKGAATRRRGLAQSSRRHLRARRRPDARTTSAATSRQARASCSTRATARSRRRLARSPPKARAEVAASRTDARGRGAAEGPRATETRAVFDNGTRRIHRGRARVRRLASAPGKRRPRRGATSSRTRVRLPRERIVARLHLVAERGREPAHAVEKRSRVRHAVRGRSTCATKRRPSVWSPTPLPAGRRTNDARPPRRGIHDLRAGESRPRARAHRLRAARRAAQGRCGFASRTRSPATAD